MRRFIFAILILFIAATSIAQTNREETAYTPPSPFSPFAESYQYSVQKLYESLPEINSTANIPGTKSLAEVELKKTLSGSINIAWYERISNLLPIGNYKIIIRKSNNNYYFWCIYGQVQFFYNHTVSRDPPVKNTQNYCLILRFREGNAAAITDYFTIGTTIIKNNSQTLDAISNEATALLAEANKEAYERVKNKSEWTINNRIELGNFHGYRNGRVSLTRNNGRVTFDVGRFSHEDQLLIRGYIDHQGIPVRDIPRPGN